ncbi:MAG: sensor histidine kinase [Anaerolineae bacterium]
MRNKIEKLLRRLTLAQRFMLASLLILAVGMAGLGAWVGQQIQEGVVHRTAATTALYVDSFVAPELQELKTSDTISPEHIANLRNLISDTPFGQQIAAFKVWDLHGKVIYSSNPAEIGQDFPVQGRVASAAQGQVMARVSDLNDEENVLERPIGGPLLEIYSPIRVNRMSRIVAVAEFYQKTDALQGEIAMAQSQTWLIVGAATLIMYLLLAGFVQSASNTIVRQQGELSAQVTQLRSLLAQNEELHERVRRAAARTAALNERFLRRISAELHDGPAQDLGVGLLRLDHISALFAKIGLTPEQAEQNTQDVEIITASMRHALQELRALSAGLGVPQLNSLTLAETVDRAVRAHKRRTNTSVSVNIGNVPAQAALPVKITVYRVIQEALNNAFRHAGGAGQNVQLQPQNGSLELEVADRGPGFIVGKEADWDEHLGLVGMRERVESLGGIFQIQSAPGQGTRVRALLPLERNIPVEQI